MAEVVRSLWQIAPATPSETCIGALISIKRLPQPFIAAVDLPYMPCRHRDRPRAAIGQSARNVSPCTT